VIAALIAATPSAFSFLGTWYNPMKRGWSSGRKEAIALLDAKKQAQKESLTCNLGLFAYVTPFI
jgi:hypothetical protein